MKSVALMCALAGFCAPADADTLMYDNFSGPVAAATGQYPTLGNYPWVCGASPGNVASSHCLRGGGRIAADRTAAGNIYYQMQTAVTPQAITYRFQDAAEAPTFVIAVSLDGTVNNMWHSIGYNNGSTFVMTQTVWCDKSTGCASSLINGAPAFEVKSGECAPTAASHSYIGSLSFYGTTAISTLQDAATGNVLCTDVASDPRLPQLIGPHFYLESYDNAAHVEVNFVQADDKPALLAISPFVQGNSRTVRSIAAAIDVSLINTSGGQFLSLFDLPASVIPEALAQLSGEVSSLSAETSISASKNFLGLLLSKPANAGDIDSAVSPAHRRSAFDFENLDAWISAYGEQSNGDADYLSGAHNASQGQVGTAVGFDYQPNRRFSAGGALGASRLTWSLPGLMSEGSAHLLQSGVYSSIHGSHGYAALGLTYSRSSIKTSRTISILGPGQYASNFDADTFGGRLELGEQIWGRHSKVALWSFAAVEEQHFHTAPYTETTAVGTPAYALRFAKPDSDQYFTDLGLKITSSSRVGGAKIDLHTNLAWRHVFVPAQTATAEFAASPDAAFTVSSTRLGPELALLSFGAEAHLAKSLVFGLTFNSALSGSSSSYNGLATLRRSW